MTKLKLLDKEATRIEKCNVCQIGKSGKAVPGEGNPDAAIVFIGEAPGRQESLTGRPFIGRSGQLLTKLIESLGLKREDVYITSPVKYFPIKKLNGKEIGRAPTHGEIEHGKIHLKKQLVIIDAKIIVLLGKVSAKGVLSRDLAINRLHGKIIKANGRNHFVTFHPAAAIRFPKIKKLIEEDFRKLGPYLKTARIAPLVRKLTK